MSNLNSKIVVLIVSMAVLLGVTIWPIELH